MTKDEIKRILDEMGVEYGKDAKLAELETLYASHATESQTHADKAETAAENDSPQAWDGSDDGEQSEEIGHDRAVVSAAHGLNMRDEQNGNVIHVLPRGAEATCSSATGNGAAFCTERKGGCAASSCTADARISVFRYTTWYTTWSKKRSEADVFGF